jgi:hypothetical protein
MKQVINDFDDFLEKATQYQTVRFFAIYRFRFRAKLIAVAQTVKNTYLYIRYFDNATEQETIEEMRDILEQNGFVQCSEIHTWEG